MNRLIKFITTFLLAGLMAACGGGGGSPGTSPGGTPPGRSPTASVSDFAIYTDKAMIANTGTDKVLVTVVAVDAGRNIVSGATVLVSSNANSVFTPGGSTTTDATGSYSGTLTIGADRTNRTITVTASVNGITKQVNVEVSSISQTGTNTVPVADFALLSSKTSIANTGTDTAVITVVAVDANRNIVPGAAVAVSAGQNSIFTPGVTPPLTNTSGIFTGTISSGSDQTLRIVTVTVTVNGIVKQINIEVTVPPLPPTTPGTSSTTATVTPVTDMVLFTDKTSLNNSGTDSALLTVQALDASRNTVAGATVAVTVDQGGVFIPTAGNLTNASGTYTGSLFIGADKADRTITITVTINGISRRVTVQVRGSTITLQAQPSTFSPGQTGTITATLLDASLNPIANVPLALTGNVPGVTGTAITTNASGIATATFTAPATAGAYTIGATGSGVSAADYQITVTAAGVIPNALTPFGSVPSLSASPNVLSVNAVGSTSNRSSLRFLFTTSSGGPISNVRVIFVDQTTGLAAVGSSIASGTTTLVTDSSGVVSTQYIAGRNSSPTNGVRITAFYCFTNFTVSGTPGAYTSSCATAGGAQGGSVDTTLTVAGAALSVSIGDDNLLSKGSGTYIKRFAVTVADSAGRAVGNAPVDISLDLTHYGKASQFGLHSLAGLPTDTSLDYSVTGVVGTSTVTFRWCQNEDVNRNGVADTTTVNAFFPGGVENRDGSLDANGQQTLQPRRSDMIIGYDNPAVTTTDANGILVVRVEYSQRFAGWLAYRVRVTANVAGSQGLAERSFITDFAQEDAGNGSFFTPAYGINNCLTAN